MFKSTPPRQPGRDDRKAWRVHRGKADPEPRRPGDHRRGPQRG